MHVPQELHQIVGRVPVAGERRLFWCVANRMQSPNRTTGGRLVCTPSHWMFRPHIVDRLTRGTTWICPTELIESVADETPVGTGPVLALAATRTWIRVTVRGHGSEFFLVWRPAKTIEELRRLLSVG